MRAPKKYLEFNSLGQANSWVKKMDKLLGYPNETTLTYTTMIPHLDDDRVVCLTEDKGGDFLTPAQRNTLVDLPEAVSKRFIKEPVI